MVELKGFNGITYKKMTGKYLLNNVVCFFFRIYDNRFLIKKTASSDDLGLSEETAYPGAKSIFFFESEDPYEIRDIVIGICNNLKKSVSH